ncbi:hypothetical protein FEM33_20065 [Dyadobacter flavalbus]|uniref:T9SS type A sorting domain-containing protein n=1 Tax=Dyadobacter flavalbus TaxID=2579942 RepID=A0A5M8QLR8_9BACT|nr:GEVED domain-containing protein [Dyadobacter flavalbus]KAA6437019.1 hypothetical protein FEM33_20065 [Dyadobacter flavalbus]
MRILYNALVCVLCIFFQTAVLAQQMPFETVADLKKTGVSSDRIQILSTPKLNNAVEKGIKPGAAVTNLELDRLKLERLKSSDQSPLYEFVLPTANGSMLTLDIFPVTVLAPDFSISVLSAQGNTARELPYVRFFRGVVSGEANSVVSLTIVNDEISGLISDHTGTRILGKNKKPGSKAENYSMYYDHDLVKTSSFSCGTDGLKIPEGKIMQQQNQFQENTSCRWVGIYIETDKATLDSLGNLTSVEHYIMNLVNAVSTTFSIEGIAVRLSGLSMWTTTDPYAGKNDDESLNIFRDLWNTKSDNFPGHFAHLLKMGNNSGLAYVPSDVCSRSYNYGLSTINAKYSFVSYPDIYGDVDVICHELGHSFGSLHTQSCTWPGGPIDNCAAVEEGNCERGPAPVNGGSIMSYCPYRKLANGFGPLPGNLIRNRIHSAECLPVSDSKPSGLQIDHVFASGARIKWKYTGSNTLHKLQYRMAATKKWTEVKTPTNSVSIFGLRPNTKYECRVGAECSGFSGSKSFTTNSNPPEYCLASGNCEGYGIGLSSIKLNDDYLSNASGCSANGYNFFSDISTPKVSKGATNKLTIDLLGYYNAQTVKAWIDYNNNGVFTEDEVIFKTDSTASSAQECTFTIASNIAEQTTRMRIQSRYFQEATDCGNIGYGETEDYQIEIISGPLPVSLVYFKADLTPENKVELTWRTARELNAAYFSIERSTDMRTFEPVAQLEAAGRSDTLETYTYLDEFPFNNLSYYRLRQTDTDGTEVLYRAVAVRVPGKDAPYPNPLTGNLLNIRATGSAQIRLLDISGKEIPFSKIPLQNGILQIVPKQRLAPGLYVITNGNAVYKFAVE